MPATTPTPAVSPPMGATLSVAMEVPFVWRWTLIGSAIASSPAVSREIRVAYSNRVVPTSASIITPRRTTSTWFSLWERSNGSGVVGGYPAWPVSGLAGPIATHPPANDLDRSGRYCCSTLLFGSMRLKQRPLYVGRHTQRGLGVGGLSVMWDADHRRRSRIDIRAALRHRDVNCVTF